MSTTDVAVIHPSHYTRGKIEVWDFIKDQGLNYDRGNVVKYICRAGHKPADEGVTDKDPSVVLLENKMKELQDINKVIAYAQHEADDIQRQIDEINAERPVTIRLNHGITPEMAEDGKFDTDLVETQLTNVRQLPAPTYAFDFSKIGSDLEEAGVNLKKLAQTEAADRTAQLKGDIATTLNDGGKVSAKTIVGNLRDLAELENHPLDPGTERRIKDAVDKYNRDRETLDVLRQELE